MTAPASPARQHVSSIASLHKRSAGWNHREPEEL